jgi:uncharacterized membrane protein
MTRHDTRGLPAADVAIIGAGILMIIDSFVRAWYTLVLGDLGSVSFVDGWQSAWTIAAVLLSAGAALVWLVLRAMRRAVPGGALIVLAASAGSLGCLVLYWVNSPTAAIESLDVAAGPGIGLYAAVLFALVQTVAALMALLAADRSAGKMSQTV